MKLHKRVAGLALLSALAGFGLSGCVSSVGPVEVTRFTAPDAPPLGQGTIRIDGQTGMDPESLEFRSYAAAVGRELARIGYAEVPLNSKAAPGQIALLSIDRQVWQAGSSGNPVSVGVGGATGSYGGGVGMGVGIDLSGPPPDQVATEMRVMIRDQASGKTLWEGRASFTVSAKSELAQTQLGAAKMAEALFRGFPGNSGETIYVK